jgi:hypothetical protein
MILATSCSWESLPPLLLVNAAVLGIGKGFVFTWIAVFGQGLAGRRRRRFPASSPVVARIGRFGTGLFVAVMQHQGAS